MSLSSSKGGVTLTLDRTGVMYDAATGPSRVYYRGTDPEIPVPEMEVSVDEYRTMLRLGFPAAGPGDLRRGRRMPGRRPRRASGR